MKLFCLEKDGRSVVLKLHGIRILLDCPLDLTKLVHFVPPVRGPSPPSAASRAPSATASATATTTSSTPSFVSLMGGDTVSVASTPLFSAPNFAMVEPHTIDVIVISAWEGMLALPFLLSVPGFSPAIYATEPTIQLGRQAMTELVTLLQDSTFDDRNPLWHQSPMLSLLPAEYRAQLAGCWMWRSLYTLAEVLNCVSLVRSLSFQQQQDVFGRLRITPVSSGLAMGSANWLFETSCEKLVWVTDSSAINSRHPAPLHLSWLLEPDLMLFTARLASVQPAFALEASLQRLLATVGATTNKGGSVLIPISTCGPAIFDLIEHIHAMLMAHASGVIPPICIVSPVAENALAFSNIFAEWLCASRQERVYVADPPFPHDDMKARRALAHYTSISAMLADTTTKSNNSPCIVFCSHPSLRFGDVIDFIRMWGGSAQNALIMVEPDYDMTQALAPFQPLAMRCVSCPIDFRFTPADASRFVSDIKPRHLVVPQSLLTPPVGSLAHRSFATLQAPPDIPLTSFGPLAMLSIPLARHFERAIISHSLALSLTPRPFDDCSIAEVHATLSTKDHRYYLDTHQQTDPIAMRLHNQRYVWGKPTALEFLNKLALHGVEPSRVVEDGDTGAVVVEIPTLEASVHFSAQRTTISTPLERSRKLLCELIVTQCSQLIASS